MRLELPDGQWAELRERLSYGQARDIRRAGLAAEQDSILLADLDLAYVVDVKEPERAADVVIQAIAKEAMKVWSRKPNPKASSETSPSTLRALG